MSLRKVFDRKVIILTLDNIYPGMKIKNYKEFCKLLDEPVKGGKGKVCQIAKWKRAIDFHRIGKVGYEIDSIIGINENTFKRKSQPYILKIDSFKLSEEEGRKSGVYIIHNDKEAYIGSTVHLRKRFLAHYENKNNNHIKTYNILQNNGIFEVLWFADENTSDKELREKEEFYINNYNDIPVLINTHLKCYDTQAGAKKLNDNKKKSKKKKYEKYLLKILIP